MMPTEKDFRLHEVLAAVLPYHCLMNPTVELAALFDSFERTGARSFLEIGTYKGATAAAFALAFPEATVTTIDLPEPTETVWNPQESSETGVALRDLGIKRVEEVRMSSAALDNWTGERRRFDMIFVDGDHSRDSVVRDLMNALDLLAPGGCVVAHDYTDASDTHRPDWTIGVYEAVEEVLRRRPDIERRRLDGWLVELRPGLRFYSQVGQDRFLFDRYFKNKTDGVFVDVGAYDGEKFSNSLFFERYMNWNGLCIEPIPSVFEKLKSTRSAHCENVCVADFEGEADFVETDSRDEKMLSGLVQNFDPRYETRLARDATSRITRRVPVTRLSVLLYKYGLYDIDYCSIDTEGSEFSILNDLDFERFHVNIFTIENNYGDPRIAELMGAKGYDLVTWLEQDAIFIRRVMT